MNIQEKLNRINELDKQLRIERNKAYEQVQKISAEINNEYRSMFDFEQKYIKLQDHADENCCTYMFCNCIHIGNNLSGSQAITFRGYGFRYSITPYEDDTWLQWDEMIEKDYLTYIGFDTILKCVTVITKQEFDKEFQTMMSNVYERHNENMEINKD